MERIWLKSYPEGVPAEIDAVAHLIEPGIAGRAEAEQDVGVSIAVEIADPDHGVRRR